MRWLSVLVVAVVAAAGCNKKAESPATPAAVPSMAAARPAAAAGATLKGKVLEKMDASIYSYLKLNTGSEEIWAAVPKTDTAVGAEVEVHNPQRMDGFESKTLNKKFEKIVFGNLQGQGEAAGGHAGMMNRMANMPMPGAQEAPPHGAMPGMPAKAGEAGAPMAMPPGMMQQHAAAAGGPADVGEIKVPKAEGADARTVAEVHAQKAALKDKPVTVRGKVVKFSAGIMGKNWVHVRDGSGSAGAKDNDLTVTTSDTVAVGDVVTVKGALHVDKDFGAGYAYPVIIEDAKVQK